MQDLRVVGVESGALVVATDAGSEFRLPVTLSLQSQLRAADPDRTVVMPKVPPREIQASIRAGRTAEQVAAETGADIDYVRRFEGPVLDERAFVLRSARAVPVSVTAEPGVLDHAGDGARFGDVIDARLDESEASGREWTAYKDAAVGWIARVTYTTSEVEREASWRFDLKKQNLAPHGGDAPTLSRQDADHSTLVPRLRAVSSERPASGASPVEAAPSADSPFTDSPFDAPAFDAPPFDGRGGSATADSSGRFDSGAFEAVPEAPETRLPSSAPLSAHARAREGWSAASLAAMNRAPESENAHNQTNDLLEALRRRRGEREAARFDESDPVGGSRAAHPSTGSIRVIDVPLDDLDLPTDVSSTADEAEVARDTEPPRATKPLATHPTASRRRTSEPSDAPSEPRQKATGRARKGRAAMPSWDEIVFGARSDDDPA